MSKQVYRPIRNTEISLSTRPCFRPVEKDGDYAEAGYHRIRWLKDRTERVTLQSYPNPEELGNCFVQINFLLKLLLMFVYL